MPKKAALTASPRPRKRLRGNRKSSCHKRGWPFQVALRAEQCRGTHYRTVHAFCLGLSLCPRGHSVCDEGEWWCVFCFAEQAHAGAFRGRFGGEHFDAWPEMGEVELEGVVGADRAQRRERGCGGRRRPGLSGRTRRHPALQGRFAEGPSAPGKHQRAAALAVPLSAGTAALVWQSPCRHDRRDVT